MKPRNSMPRFSIDLREFSAYQDLAIRLESEGVNVAFDTCQEIRVDRSVGVEAREPTPGLLSHVEKATSNKKFFIRLDGSDSCFDIEDRWMKTEIYGTGRWSVPMMFK